MQPVPSRLAAPVMFEALEPRLLLAVAPVVDTPIGPVTVNEGAAATLVDLFNHFSDPDITGVVYQFQGTMDTFNVHLFENQTPVTAANFRAYADAGDWTNTFIHRSVPGFIIQGGGFTFANGQFGYVNDGDPIINEPGISNTRGTIAMAKLGGDPNSATNEWFFNLGDNSANLDNQNGGFTVFGEVLGSGMDVIDAIAEMPIYNGTSIDPALTDVPLQNYAGGPVQTENFALFTSIARIDELGFQVTANTNPGLVTAAVNGGQLTLTYAPNQYGAASITLRATDLDGQTVDSTFGVTVNAEGSFDPPTVGTFSKKLRGKVTLVFASGDFTGYFNDPEGASLQRVKITSLPSHGTLKLGKLLVTLNREIPFAQLGTLSYTPASKYAGPDSFGWNGSDGALYAVAGASVNLMVEARPPTVSAMSKAVAFNTTFTFAASDFTQHFVDTDPGDSLQKVKITKLPKRGSLKLNGAAVVANQEIPVAQLGNLTYTPTVGYSGKDSFCWIGSDGVWYASKAALVNLTVS